MRTSEFPDRAHFFLCIQHGIQIRLRYEFISDEFSPQTRNNGYVRPQSASSPCKDDGVVAGGISRRKKMWLAFVNRVFNGQAAVRSVENRCRTSCVFQQAAGKCCLSMTVVAFGSVFNDPEGRGAL